MMVGLLVDLLAWSTSSPSLAALLACSSAPALAQVALLAGSSASPALAQVALLA
jgi:hypothetical protein